MSRYPKLQGLLDAAVVQAASEAGMLLGQELTVEPLETLQTNRLTYFADIDEGLMLLAVNVSGEVEGEFYLVLTVKDAIVLAGVLLGISAARIKEKKTLSIFEPDDNDAFGEIANQLVGSFNMAMQGVLGDGHVRLKQQPPPARFVPGVDEFTPTSPLADGDYLLYTCRPVLAGQELDRFDMLLPLALAAAFDPAGAAAEEAGGEVEAEAGPVAPETDADRPVAPAAPGHPVVVLWGHAEASPVLTQAAAAAGLEIVRPAPGDGPHPADAKLRAVLVVLELERADSDRLGRLREINSGGGARLPVLVRSEQWTRRAALQALKNGANSLVAGTDVESLAAHLRSFASG